MTLSDMEKERTKNTSCFFEDGIFAIYFAFIITKYRKCKSNEYHSFVIQDSKYELNVYIESLCGDCHRFIANELKFIALHPELLDYVDLRLHIFGKARITSRSPARFQCQFGEEGCIGNKALNCIYSHTPSFTYAIKIMECIYESGYSSEESIRMCFDKFYQDSSEAIQCFKSDEANQLLLVAGDNTPALRWVPAFSDGTKIRFDTRNIVREICNHIEGERPEICATERHTVGMDSDLYSVCWKHTIYRERDAEYEAVLHC